jgi:hypothetical protein
MVLDFLTCPSFRWSCRLRAFRVALKRKQKVRQLKVFFEVIEAKAKLAKRNL